MGIYRHLTAEVFSIGFLQSLERFVKYIWKTHLWSYVNEAFFFVEQCADYRTYLENFSGSCPYRMHA